MVGNDEESKANEVLKERQRGIVRSVLTRGLIGGSDARTIGSLPSADVLHNGPDRIDGVLVNPLCRFDRDGHGCIPRLTDGDDSFRYLTQQEVDLPSNDLRLLMTNEVLHRGNSSVFGVVVERHGESVDALGKLPIEKIEQRALHSVLAVARRDDITRTNGAFRDKWEFPVRPPVEPSALLHVVVPKTLERIVLPIIEETSFPLDKICWVGMSEKTLFLPRVKGDSPYATLEVPTLVTVPDYFDFLAQREEYNLWVHGVRLPTIDDLK